MTFFDIRDYSHNFDNTGFPPGKIDILKVKDEARSDIASARINNGPLGLSLSVLSSEELFGNFIYTSPHNTTLLVSKGTVFEIE